MSTTKIAITIPKNILEIIDQYAKNFKLPRSRIITNIIREKVEENEKDKLTKLTDQVFSNSKLRKEQKKVAKSFMHISNIPEEDY